MAAGDILSVTVGADGWFVDLVIEGFTTGAVYNFGLTADNAPTATTPYLTVVSEGYSASAVLGTITRTIHLTKVLRKAHPNDAQLDETVGGGNLTVRVALSDFVYDDDKAGGAGTSGTNPTFTAPSGFVTSGGTPSAARSASAVVNSSTLDYPQVIANWSRPDRFRLTSASLTEGVLAFSGLPLDRKPVACVKFTAADESTHATSVIVTTPTIDSGYGDAVPVIEYVGTLNLSTFTDDDLVTSDFAVYPWVGDANSVLDTAVLAQVESGQTPRHYSVLDVDGSRGYPICVVDPNAADDTSGVVYASDSPANRASAAATPYKFLFTAVKAIQTYNNTNLARNNAAGATIYLAAGTSEAMGGAITTSIVVVGNKWTWLTVTPLPGVTTAKVIPSVTVANRNAVTPGIRWLDVAFERSLDHYWFYRSTSDGKLLVDGCSLLDTRTPNTYATWTAGYTSMWVQGTTLTRIRAEGAIATWRGNTWPQGYTIGRLQRVIAGNMFTASEQQSRTIQIPGAGTDVEGAILAFNKGMAIPDNFLTAFQTDGVNYLRGFAVVQNLFEHLDTANGPSLLVAGLLTAGSTKDCVIWHNTIAGERINIFYNDRGTARVPHLGHSVCLNALEYFANKGDTFNDPTNGPQGARTGGWSIDNGVRTWGNRVMQGTFDQRFQGLWSKGGDDFAPLLLGFTDDRSLTGTGTGGGDYHPTAGSVLLTVPTVQMLPFDLDGLPRAEIDAAGAYRGIAAVKRRIGADAIDAVRVGTQTVTKLYLGTVEV